MREVPIPALDLPSWDPAATWRRLQETSTDGTNRLDAAADLAFWERVAPSYHLECLAVRVPKAVERVLRHVLPGESVLEVGAGSGGFTLPVARVAGRAIAPVHHEALPKVYDATPWIRYKAPIDQCIR